MTTSDNTVFRLVAQEDVTYRIGDSYPKEGFFVKRGDSIRITSEGLRLIQVRRVGTKQRGQYVVEAL